MFEGSRSPLKKNLVTTKGNSHYHHSYYHCIIFGGFVRLEAWEKADNSFILSTVIPI